MAGNKSWQLDLEEYIRQGEPDQAARSEAWQIAIGLQQVDGLTPSKYLIDVAKEHIEGNISIHEVHGRIQSYYEEQRDRKTHDLENEEADKVSLRITELLQENTFQFSPAEWLMIHRRIFGDIFVHAGQIRPYNITKKEWVLNGDTVIYASCDSIRATMDYDFAMEKQFSYAGLSMEEIVHHLAEFVANVWQIHPFCEGNTRATAVFLIKYMRTLGLNVKNDSFKDHSWYFRNALVRANYNDLKKGIHATTVYLERFFANLLWGAGYELKNRYLNIDYAEEKDESSLSRTQSLMEETVKSQNATLQYTQNEIKTLEYMKNNPSMRQMELAQHVGVSLGTMKRITVRLQEKGCVKRSGPKNKGMWEVLIEI